VLDFLVRVVNAGYSGVGTASSCTVGLSPPGSKVCNSLPEVAVPASEVRFICNERSSFEVTARDGDGNDASASVPRGVFAVRHRQRVTLNAHYPKGECSIRIGGGGGSSCVDDGDCRVRQAGNCTKTDFVPQFPQVCVLYLARYVCMYVSCTPQVCVSLVPCSDSGWVVLVCDWGVWG
jgi:hypothetical protein